MIFGRTLFGPDTAVSRRRTVRPGRFARGAVFCGNLALLAILPPISLFLVPGATPTHPGIGNAGENAEY